MCVKKPDTIIHKRKIKIIIDIRPDLRYIILLFLYIINFIQQQKKNEIYLPHQLAKLYSIFS